MRPNKLQEGDTIGIVAPSQPFSEQRDSELENFIKYMGELNIKVKLSKNLYAKDKFGVSAGTPEERAEDINSMFADKEINAIWCAHGGNPANQVLDLIDYDLVKENPKLFMGKSDIDVLLLALNKKADLITIHCCDPKIGRKRELDFDYTKKWLKKRLFESSKEVEPSEEWTCMNEGKVEGKILGCNLISLLKLAGSEYFPDFTDSILFIEECKSEAGTLIAELAQLKLLGVIDKLKGIVIGHNFEFKDEDFKVEEIVKEFMKDYDIPILKINEFGHYQPHAFLPIGARVMLDATNKKIEIIEDFLNNLS